MVGMGDQQTLQRVVAAFIQRSDLSQSSPPLAALYSMNVGLPIESSVPSSQVLADWPLHLASLVANAVGTKKPSALQAIMRLGQSLRNYSSCAAHACFIVAGCRPGRPFPTLWNGDANEPPIVLVGSALSEFGRRSGRTFATVEALQATEVLEWVELHRTSAAASAGEISQELSRQNTQSTKQQMALQAYKLIHAAYLADIGQLAMAQRYLDGLKASISGYGIELGKLPSNVHRNLA